MSEYWQQTGRRIRLERQRRSLTRGQLAYKTGIATHTIARIERGQGGHSTHLQPLLAYLDLTPDSAPPNQS